MLDKACLSSSNQTRGKTDDALAMVKNMAASWRSAGATAKTRGKFTIAKCGVKGEWRYPLYGTGPEVLFVGKTFAESAAESERLT